MSDRVFLDTNVLVYLFDADEPGKRAVAARLLEERGDHAVLSTQVLQEFYAAVTRKLGKPLTEAEAETAVRHLAALDVVVVDTGIILAAVQLSRRHRVAFWDALIVEAALSRGCTTLLSEDMQDGRRFDTLTVANPFRSASSSA
jgi:predicted nucleic acid-binding protein